MVGGGQEDTGADQLEQQARGRGTAHLGEPGGDQVRGTGQVGGTESGRLGDQPLAGVLGDVDEPRGGRVGDRGDDDQVAQATQEVLGEPSWVLAGLDDLVDHAEDRRAVTGREGVDDLVEQAVGGVAEQARGQRVGHALRTGATEQLVEHRERVARAAAPGADDQRDRGLLDGHALLLAQLGEVAREQPRRDQPEGVVVGAGADRPDHLVGLGRGEDEPQVRRRLLDQLEQGVEALRGDHVGLVDDVDLVAAAHRREERLLAQVAGVVDATVGGRVDLDHVDRARAATRQVAAGVALPARVGDRALLAVERAREDARRGGLAAAARAREEVGVVDPVVGQGRAQGRRHVVLPDDLAEGLGPVAAVQGERRLHAPTLTSTVDIGHGAATGLGRAPAVRSSAAGCGHEKAPRAPDRAHLPLLPLGPGGVGRDAATRGVAEESR